MFARNHSMKRILAAVVLAGAAMVTSQTRAQVQAQAQVQPNLQDLSPEDQQSIQQMQQFGQQVMQNMQNAGIDPQQFFQDMAQQTQDGTLDQDAVQQMLIDKGVITQDMMNQMQGTMQKLTLSAIRREIDATDEEWTVLQPKVSRILTAQADVDLNKQTGAAGGAGRRTMMPSNQATQAAKALRALKAVLKEQNLPDSTIAAKLQAWRDAHQRAEAELAAAQADLTKVVTLRQEANLLRLGIL